MNNDNNDNNYVINSDPTIPARIEALLNEQGIGEWEKNFLISILAGFRKYGSLTAGQNKTFHEVEKRYDAAAKAARAAWFNEWNEEKANTWNVMCQYYSRTGYFTTAVNKWAKDKAYIPNQKEYENVCENKYAKRFMHYRSMPAKFAAGSLIVYRLWSEYKLGTIVEVGEVDRPAKGTRWYRILPAGEAKSITVEEKDMLYYRESMNEKLTLNDIPF